jgi:excisionase family DNA binding protein
MFDTNTAKNHFDLDTAAAHLGVSVGTLRRMIARREIGFIRLGSRRGRLVLNEAHLSEYLARRTSQPIAA